MPVPAPERQCFVRQPLHMGRVRCRARLFPSPTEQAACDDRAQIYWPGREVLLVEDIFQPPSGNRRTPSTSTVARCLRKAAMIEAESAVRAEQLLQGEVGGSAFTRQVHVDSCQPDKKTFVKNVQAIGCRIFRTAHRAGAVEPLSLADQVANVLLMSGIFLGYLELNG